MTRAVLFDLDGTLIDSTRDLAEAVNHALRRLALPERSIAEIAGFVGEGARRLVERAVAPRADLAEPALALWWEHYRAHLLDHTVLCPGIAGLLAAARVPLAVHTNKPGGLARRILDGLGVLGRFAEVLGGDEAPRKPDPAGTRALLGRMGVAPAEALYVGDSVIDVELAATAVAVPAAVLFTAAESSFVIVAVWTVVAPRVALVGVPMVRITVSSGSTVVSLVMVIVAVPVVLPAAMVIGLAVIV